MKMTAFLSLSLFLSAHAAEPSKTPPQKPKSSFNTQIYEQESEETSFETTVKWIRDVQNETNVFFEGKPGFYVLSSNESRHLLIRSQEKQIPVRVVVNTTNKQILKVELLGPKKD